MPNVEVDGYQIGFYMKDVKTEPPHVHVKHSGKEAKYWLNPVRFQRNRGYSNRELNDIERILQHEQARLLAMWDAAKGQAK